MKIRTLIISALLSAFAATPALACFPGDPTRSTPSAAEIAEARTERQGQMWDLSSSVYVGRIVSADWASEAGPAPRDMGATVVIESVSSVRGALPPRQTLEMIACEPQGHARATWRPGAQVVVYARRISLFDDWRRAGQWQVFDFIPVAENVDHRVAPALRTAARTGH